MDFSVLNHLLFFQLSIWVYVLFRWKGDSSVWLSTLYLSFPNLNYKVSRQTPGLSTLYLSFIIRFLYLAFAVPHSFNSLFEFHKELEGIISLEEFNFQLSIWVSGHILTPKPSSSFLLSTLYLSFKVGAWYRKRSGELSTLYLSFLNGDSIWMSKNLSFNSLFEFHRKSWD